MNNLSYYLLEAMKLTVPALLVAAAVVYIVRLFINKDQQMRILEVKMNSNKDVTMIRLQAYERMILLLERMHPSSVIQRVIEPGMNARGLQFAMTTTIQSEFEHNYAQQLYISSDAWNLINASKTEVIKMVNILANATTPETSAQEFSTMILNAIIHSEQPLPSQTALEFLKAEAREIF